MQGSEEALAQLEELGEATEDPMPHKVLELLCCPPAERDALTIDRMLQYLTSATPDTFGVLNDQQQGDFCRACLYHHFAPGSEICGPDDETAYFFVLLSGSVVMNDLQVSMVEGELPSASQRRRSRESGEKQRRMSAERRMTMDALANYRPNTRRCELAKGQTFHHFPLVMNHRFYGYSASVDAAEGASLLILPKSDYLSLLRRQVEKDMVETVALLKGTPFFAKWSETAMSRLFFWWASALEHEHAANRGAPPPSPAPPLPSPALPRPPPPHGHDLLTLPLAPSPHPPLHDGLRRFEKKRFNAEAEVVTQGEDADFCFIIRSGKCDVNVKVRDEDEIDPAEAAGMDEEELAKLKEAKEKEKKRKQMLKMMAGNAFAKAGGMTDAPAMQLNTRHIATLGPGALVGEIALLKDGSKRMASVKTVSECDVLTLDKKSFRDLDKATISIISENARYNAACTKEPATRTRDDLTILQQRTAHLSHLASLSNEVHLELCKVMRYRNVKANTILVRKGHPARSLYVLISGSAHTYTADPRRRWGLGVAAVLRKAAPAEAYADVKPNETITSGEAIGEDELLKEDPVHAFTAITAEPTELMEIERADFDRCIKAAGNSEKARVVDFLNGLSPLEGTSVFAIQTLCNLVTKRTFMRGQSCLAHPPASELTSASYSSEHVYIILSGEGRLMCASSQEPPAAAPKGGKKGDKGGDEAGDDKGRAEKMKVVLGPTNDAPPPSSAKVERVVGGGVSPLVPVATLGPGEVLSENLLPHAHSRWCIKPITHLELLVVPRREWVDTLRPAALSSLREISAAKAAFFEAHLAATLERADKRKALMSQGRGHRLSSAASSGHLTTGEATFADAASSPSRQPGGGGHGGGHGGASLGGSSSATSLAGGSPGNAAAATPRNKKPDSRSKQQRYRDLLTADKSDESPLVKRSVYFPIDSPMTSAEKLGSPKAGAEMGGTGLASVAEGEGGADAGAAKGLDASGTRLPDISSPAGAANTAGAGLSTSMSLPAVKGATPAPDDFGGYDYKPVIRLERRSAMGMRPLIAGA